MEIVYTGEEIPDKISKSIFLAGPSLRPDQIYEMESWRKDAFQILEDKGFDGTIFCPENRDWKMNEGFDYDAQVEWEERCLNVADCIVFWVPRDLTIDGKGNPKLAAFTTNVEWGTWNKSGKVVFGSPPKAPKNTYLRYYADKYNVPVGDTLTETLDAALEKLGDGAVRTGGERFIPLHLWNTDSFQAWYRAQVDAGNRLDHAEVLWTFSPRFKDFVYAWVLRVDVYIGEEDRHKTNEFVLARTDISSVLLWKKKSPIEKSEVVLVKEFRSPARTIDGFVRELPGGSSPKKDEDPQEVAAEEVHEETGFHLPSNRLTFHGSRQLAGTFSSHHSHLFSAELDADELAWFKSQDGIVHGNVEDSERTFIEVYTIQELLDTELTDWTTLGQILSVVMW
jgi:8-oxo-dGTP pyrophosphatase MutT (NUDIX family)